MNPILSRAVVFLHYRIRELVSQSFLPPFVSVRLTHVRHRTCLSEAIVKIICAWCQQDGEQMLIDELELFDRGMTSHGICRTHKKLVLNQIREPRKRKYPRSLRQKQHDANTRTLARLPSSQTTRTSALRSFGLPNYRLCSAQLRFPFPEI